MELRFVFYYGLLLFLVSLILIFKPGLLIRLNKATDKVVFTDSGLFANPYVSGIIFIVLGAILIYLGFTYKEFF